VPNVLVGLLTEENDVKGESFAEQHHHRLGVPETVNVRHKVGETLHDDTVDNGRKPEIYVTTSTTKS